MLSFKLELIQSCKSDWAFRVGFGQSSGLKLQNLGLNSALIYILDFFAIVVATGGFFP